MDNKEWMKELTRRLARDPSYRQRQDELTRYGNAMRASLNKKQLQLVAAYLSKLEHMELLQASYAYRLGLETGEKREGESGSFLP